MTTWEEKGWGEEDLNKLSLSFLNGIFKLNEVQGVDATLFFAHYMRMVTVNPDNYPLFLKIIEMKNHWIVDAVIGDSDPEHYFDNVQPNYFIVNECFRSFERAQPQGIYEKSLLVFMGILMKTYKNPLEGYRIYPLTEIDINNLGKHLLESENQLYPLNAFILTILDKVSELIDPGKEEDNQEIIKIATQSSKIRNTFLDMTKNLTEAIPELLLEKSNLGDIEIKPSTE
jgi:hypothetical protein